MNVRFLDPTAGPAPSQAQLAPRREQLGTLRRIALLDNGKPNARQLLQHVADALGAGQPDLEWRLIRKPSAFKPAPAAVLADAAGCDAVITGVGD